MRSRQSIANVVSLLWVSQPKLGFFAKSRLFSNFLEAFGSDFFWVLHGARGHLFEKLHTSMLQFLKSPIRFSNVYIHLDHRGNTRSRQNDAKALSLLWGGSAEIWNFIKSQLFSNFSEGFGSDFLWFGMGPGESPFWRAPSRDASIP